jgi:hypothetical protein
MSLILLAFSLLELLYMKRNGRFFLLVILAGILFIKDNKISDYSFWDLGLVVLLMTFVLNRFKIDHRLP